MTRLLGTAGAALAAIALTAACSGAPDAPADAGEDRSQVQGDVGPPPSSPASSAESEPPAAEPPAAEPPPEPRPPTADELAGVRSRDVPPRGNGATTAVPGGVPAPGGGQERRVRVEVEGGLDVDGPAFADFVLATLNDPRSWARDGFAFSRTDGDADVVVVLASPETSAAMCAPLRTNGTLSCRKGPQAILTHYRWVNGMEDYGADLTGYRQYLVNHEVGHVLGHGHVSCPAPGAPAPVMQQQTKDVDPCVPNSWPYP